MTRTEALLTELETRADSVEKSPTLEAVARYVETRAPLAAELAAVADRAGAPLAARLAHLLERDLALIAKLAQRRDEIIDQMRGVALARTAARGYRGPGAGSRLFRKTA